MPDVHAERWQSILRMERDAARYAAFRQLIRDDKLRAQALVWESGGSRRQFDRLVDGLLASLTVPPQPQQEQT